MRKQGEGISVSSTLTVYFDGRFWVGIAERTSSGRIEAARYVFGAEPTSEEVYQLVRRHWTDLTFSTTVEEACEAPRVKNPKRRQREAAREAASARPSTKAQEALAQERERLKGMAAEKRVLHEREERRRRFELKQEKHKRKHRGH